GLDGIAARTDDGRLVVARMNAFLHGGGHLNTGVPHAQRSDHDRGDADSITSRSSGRHAIDGTKRAAMTAARSLVLVLALAGVAGAGPPCTGRFGTNVGLVTGAAGVELIDVARGHVTVGACGTVKARVKGRRRATRVKAVFGHCPGVTGNA